jgi:transposase
MKDFDGRSLDHATLEYVRVRAVKAVGIGMSAKEVGEIFGVHRSRVYDWVKRANQKGMAALKAKPVPGRKPALDEQQEKILTLVRGYPTCF